MIAIVDYQMGNLRSVEKGFEHAGVADVVVTGDPEVVSRADGIVVPGVGAFGDAAANLEAAGLADVLRERVAAGTPYLGICLGLQLLADVGYEDGEWKGLSIVHGVCERLSGDVKVPHIGWNTVEYTRPSRLFEGIPDSTAFYFVHSYHLVPDDGEVVTGTTEYGQRFVSAVQCDNVFAVQFHPEKSSSAGLALLANFAKIVNEGSW